jgi:hypothetical protein
MALGYLILYISYTGGGHCRLHALHYPTPLLLCCPLLHWVLSDRPSPLFVSSTTQLPCAVCPPLSLRPLPPDCFALPAPPSPSRPPPPNCLALSMPPAHLTLCPCLPTINCHAHCSNHCRHSLNLIAAFFPRCVTPIHHHHCPIALYRVLCPALLVVLSAAQLPCVMYFVPLFLLWRPSPSSCHFLRHQIVLRCPQSINDNRAEWDMCEEREGRKGAQAKMVVLDHT